jgi:hypothetical protein
VPAPQRVFANPSIVIDGHDVSTQAFQAQFTTGIELLDITLFGDANRRKAVSLGTTTLTMKYFHEYAATSIDTILRGLWRSLGFTIVIRPDRSRAVDVDNPSYTATYVFLDYQAFEADVTSASTGDVTFTAVSDFTVATS